MDHFIRRAVMMTLGLVSGIAAGVIFMPIAALFDPTLRESGALVIAVAIFAAVFDALEGHAVDPGGVFAGLVWLAAMSVSAAPLVIAALIGEVARLRSVLWYMAATSIVAAAVPWSARLAQEAMRHGDPDPSQVRGRLVLLFFLTGCVAGFVYWLISGRNAGRTEADAPPPVRNWSR